MLLQVLLADLLRCRSSLSTVHARVWQDHPQLARKVLLQSAVRPSFPSLFHGRERQFEAGNILAVAGEKHKSLRAAWQPMFFSGRRGGRRL